MAVLVPTDLILVPIVPILAGTAKMPPPKARVAVPHMHIDIDGKYVGGKQIYHLILSSSPSASSLHKEDKPTMAPPPGIKPAPAPAPAPPKSKTTKPTKSKQKLSTSSSMKKISPQVLQLLQNQKSRLTIVILGHVDAGKSTLMGQVLVQCGQVEKRTVNKYAKQGMYEYVCMCS
jgi:hypothetical protein